MNTNADFTLLARDWGIHTLAVDYLRDDYRDDVGIAMDAQPALVTTPNAGIPTFLTTLMDPEVVRIYQAPNKGAEILGEAKKGNWTTETEQFSVLENTGFVAAYGDRNDAGRSDINLGFEFRQSFHFQTFIDYGDREVDIGNLAVLNVVAEKQASAAKTMTKFLDYTYHYGVAGLQNFGILNDPSLSPALTPSTKANGGTAWVKNGSTNASANEVVIDIQALLYQVISQSGGNIDAESGFTLVMPPISSVGMMAINSFGQDVSSLLKKGFPNLKVKTSPRYATPAGNVVQLIADEIDGNAVGTCAFTEKLREHRIIPEASAFRQKRTSGSWGAVIKYPICIATMIGV